jgi:uncharacterized protein
VPLDRFGSRTLLTLALLAALNLPYVYQLFLVLGDASIDPRPYAVWNLYGRAFEIFSQGSLAEVLRFNTWSGQVMKWGWYLQEGRIWQILGLFLVGMVVGRWRFFEDIERHRRRCRRLLAVSLLGFAALAALRAKLDALPLSDNAAYLADKLSSSYANLSFTAVWITGFALLFLHPGWRRRLSVLAPLGRMSLTNYVVQSMVGIPFFYAFGLGMYRFLGPTLSLAFGVVLVTLTIWVSRLWLRRFHFGPLEWLWRAATYGTTDIPFVRQRG